MTLRDAVIGYARQGLAVFRLAPRSKVPLKGTAGFKDASTDPARCLEWGDENIGIAPGRSTLFGGLCILDADGPHGMAAVQSYGLLELAGFQVLTGKPDSRHLYFRRPPFRVGNRKLAPNVDVRCDDGYGLLPPSQHPNGATYRAIGDVSLIRALPGRVAEILEQLQRDEQPESTVVDLPTPAIDDLDARVRSYLATVGHRAIGDRDNTAYRVAAWLLKDMAIGDDAAWAYLSEWNRGNDPPLSERELRAKLKSAQKHGKHVRGSGIVRVHQRDPFARCRLSEATL